MTRLALALGVAFFLSLALAGCGQGGGSGVSRSNYDKIDNGMTLPDVEKLLGQGKLVPLADQVAPGPTQAQGIAQMKADGIDTYLWTSGEKMIKVKFQRGKVVDKGRDGLD